MSGLTVIDEHFDILEFRAVPFISSITYLSKTNLTGVKKWWDSVKNTGTTKTCASDYLKKYHSWQHCHHIGTKCAFDKASLERFGYKFIPQVLEMSIKNNPTCGMFELHSKLLHALSKIFYEYLHVTDKWRSVSPLVVTTTRSWFSIFQLEDCKNLFRQNGSDGAKLLEEIHSWGEKLSAMHGIPQGDEEHPFLDIGTKFVHIADITYRFFKPVDKQDYSLSRGWTDDGLARERDQDEFNLWKNCCFKTFHALFHSSEGILTDALPIYKEKLQSFTASHTSNVSTSDTSSDVSTSDVSPPSPPIHEIHIAHCTKALVLIEETLNKSTHIPSENENNSKEFFVATVDKLVEDVGAELALVQRREKQRQADRNKVQENARGPRLPPDVWEDDYFMLGDCSIHYLHTIMDSVFSPFIIHKKEPHPKHSKKRLEACLRKYKLVDSST